MPASDALTTRATDIASMEFNFSIPGLEAPGITVWDACALVQLSSVDFHKLRSLLENFGQRSAAAQGLKAPITDVWKLRSSDQRLYLQTEQAPPGCCVVLGGLKVGKKKLFMHRANGAIVEVEPLCVLDFYVHEAYQRQGVGKALFEHMLESEQLGAEQLGYDRPSSKLLAFLRKHYHLASYVPQPNSFVLFEQFYENMPGSPERGGKLVSSSGSSTPPRGPGARASLGHGLQTLHIIGSRAAAVTGVDPGAPDLWTRSSQRPPTASLQHSVQLHTTHTGSSGGGSSMSLGGSSACSTQTSLGGAPAAAWTPLGGPGCPTAGSPTRKGDWDQPALSPTARQSPYQQQQQQSVEQVQPPVHYRRGQGMKELTHCSHPAEPYSHAGFQQALMAGAANPAPPRVKAGPLPQQPEASIHSRWQQQQQQRASWGGSCSSAQERCGDSLDRLVGGITEGGTSGGGAAAAGCVGAYGNQINSVLFGASTGMASSQAGRQAYSPSPPYGSWEPRPGSLLPRDAGETERVSLRRQAAQQAQHRLQLQVPQWEAAGAGPPGHLLASPTQTYAVATAGMAEVVCKGSGGGGSQQQTGHGCPDGGVWGAQSFGRAGGSSRNGSSRNGSSLCLSWDGLPTNLAGQQQGGQQGGAYAPGSGMESRIAAATARSGSGAASCMRMV